MQRLDGKEQEKDHATGTENLQFVFILDCRIYCLLQSNMDLTDVVRCVRVTCLLS